MITRQSLGVFFGAAVVMMPAAVLGAQQTTTPAARSISSCTSGKPGGGPDCALDRRLLIDVRTHGTDASNLYGVIALSASSGGAFRLTPDQATSADSAVYSVIDVQRESSGAFRIEVSLQGSRFPGTRNCSGYETGSADDLDFGAILAIKTAQLVRCAQNARERVRSK